MDRIGPTVRGMVTLIVVILAAWWLVQVALRLGTAPVKDQGGNIVLDEYQRAKDILLVVLPLVTTTFGYWFGAQGRERAERQVNDAKQAADSAETKYRAVLSVAPPDILQEAKKFYPGAFESP
jgi:hypothetical protein